jgi:predicted nucleotide-binding protein
MSKPKVEVAEEEKVISRRGRGRPAADAQVFPRHTLKNTLSVAQAIEQNNAGKPYNRIDLANAIDSSPGSSAFKAILTSSTRYGLTTGGQKAEKIELTELGACIVSPTDKSDVSSCIRSALTFPNLFKSVYEYFNNNKVPREQIFKNTLKNEFKVAPVDIEECYRIITENANDYGILVTTKAGEYLQLDKLAEKVVEPEAEQDSQEEIKPLAQVGKAPEKVDTVQIPKQIFIAHGKNMTPLQQLKDILTQFKVPFKVAVDEPHKGRPISKKVAELMENCSSGIFIFTADEDTIDSGGNPIFRPTDNVVFELGAGTILYQDRIVILRESGVGFGSDFTEFGRISFEKDNLKAKGLDLMKELISMGFLEVTPKA